MGHFLEARREGLRPKWPVFIPFLGAYVQYTRGQPVADRHASRSPARSSAGPPRSSVTSIGRADDSSVLIALAYFGFILNLFNLLPIWILDGAAVWRSTRWLWLGGGREKAIVSAVLYGGTALCSRSAPSPPTCRRHRL